MADSKNALTSHVEAVQPLKPVTPVQTATPAPEPVVAPPTQPTTHEQLMAAAGIAPSDYEAVTYIIDHESGWCSTKSEGQIGIGCPDYSGYSSAGYGMCQSTPAIKMSVMGQGWETDPVLQLKWCSDYATQRYGGWQAAYQHWLITHNW